MLKKVLIVTSLAILTLMAGAATSGNLPKQRELPPPTEEYPQTQAATNQTIANLSHHVDLWHDAILKGDEKAARHWEDELISIVNGDIEDTKRTVRHYARKSSLAGTVELKPEAQDQGEREQNVKAAFKTALSILSIKEQLALSFARTGAFSNKYRLISDYIEVLRGQLGMPRVKLASEEPARGTTVPPEKQDQ